MSTAETGAMRDNWLALMMLSGVAAPAMAGGCETALVGAIGGAARDVAVSDGYAFVANERGGLLVVDVSDPAAPSIVTLLDIGERLLDLVVVGDAVAALGVGSLHVIDVSDPADPSLLYETDFVVGVDGLDIAAQGSLVYIVQSPPALLAVDLTEPADPVVVYDSAEGVSFALELAVREEALYLIEPTLGVHTFDLSDASAPAFVGTTVLVAGAFNMTFFGPVGYLGLGSGLGVGVLDLVEPLTPQVEGLALGGVVDGAVWAEVLDGVLWAASSSGQLIAATLIDPLDPRPLSELELGFQPDGLTSADGLLYAISEEDGLLIIDPGGGVSPAPLGGVDTPSDPFTLEVEGDVAVLAEYQQASIGDLEVYRVTDPSLPERVSTLALPAPPRDLVLRDGLAYAAVNYEGIAIVDLRDPAAPAVLGSAKLVVGAACPVGRVAVDGSLVYAASGSGLLGVFDVSDPTDPVQVGVLEDPLFDNPSALLPAGDLVYAADDDTGLLVVDVSSASSPTLLAQLAPGPGFRDLALNGQALYAAAGCLLTIDVSDPSAPFVRDELDVTSFAIDLTLAGDALIVGSAGAGADVVDVSSAFAPVVAGSVGLTAHGVWDSAVEDGLIYLAQDDWGLTVFAASCVPACADADGSGVVDSGDLNAVLAAFGCVSGCGAADVDGDGAVGSGDLGLVLAGFGDGCAG